MGFCSSRLVAVLGHLTGFATEQAEVLINATLALNLGARSEDGFGLLNVLVLPVLDPEVPDLLPLLPFLFVVVWA